MKKSTQNLRSKNGSVSFLSYTIMAPDPGTGTSSSSDNKIGPLAPPPT